jgi:hypothetical protein
VSTILSGRQPVAGSLSAISSRLTALRCRLRGVIGYALSVARGLECDLRLAGRLQRFQAGRGAIDLSAGRSDRSPYQ